MNKQNKNNLIIAVLLLVCVGLLILSQNKIEEGEVIEKKYQEAHASIQMKPSASGMTPQLVHQPESWSVLIAAHTDERLCSVNQDEWNTIEVGDWFTCEQ